MQEAMLALWQQANHRLNTNFPAPKLLLNQRGAIAGSAHLQKNLVKLNPHLLRHNKAEFVQQVLPHELAHLLVFQIHGNTKPHGIEWRNMMTDVFACRPAVRHNLDTSVLPSKSFRYECQCGPINLSKIRHNRVLTGQQQYRCKQCSELLQYSPA